LISVENGNFTKSIDEFNNDCRILFELETLQLVSQVNSELNRIIQTDYFWKEKIKYQFNLQLNQTELSSYQLYCQMRLITTKFNLKILQLQLQLQPVDWTLIEYLDYLANKVTRGRYRPTIKMDRRCMLITSFVEFVRKNYNGERSGYIDVGDYYIAETLDFGFGGRAPDSYYQKMFKMVIEQKEIHIPLIVEGQLDNLKHFLKEIVEYSSLADLSSEIYDAACRTFE
jgi:hypothetical protein